MTKMNMFKPWRVKFGATVDFGTWSWSFNRKDVIDYTEKLLEELNYFIRPISIDIDILRGNTYEDATDKENMLYTNIDSYSPIEMTSLLKKELDKRQKDNEKNFLRLSIACQTHLIVWQDGELKNIWYPTLEKMNDILRKDDERGIFMECPIGLFCIGTHFVMTAYCDIWMPYHKRDILASINSKKLESVILRIEKILGKEVDSWEGWRPVMKYGFKDPSELTDDEIYYRS